MKKYDILYKITPVVLNKPCDNQYHLNKLPIIFPSDKYESKKLAFNITFWSPIQSTDNLDSYIVTEYIVSHIREASNVKSFGYWIEKFEENQAIASFPMEIINEYIAEIYDNGDKFWDRYTIIYKEKLEFEDKKYFQYVACNEEPTDPQGGFWQHGEIEVIPRHALGKKIPFQALPNAVKRCLIYEIMNNYD